MKRVIVIILTFVIAGIGVIFSIHYLFHGNIAGGEGLFEGTGKILSATVEPENTVIPTLTNSSNNATVPLVEYKGQTQTMGSSATFKSLFEVTTETGTKNGNVEDDFTIYLSDIRTTNDVSVIEFHTTEEIEAIEEIPAAFLYDIQTDTLYFCKSGVYTVLLKIYGSNGTQAEYEFSLPVEVD